MKKIVQKSLVILWVIVFSISASMAQRVIEGTVYMDGEPAAGVTVEANRGNSMLTSFDGKYKVNVVAKSKWIKFTFIDESKKIVLDENFPNHFDFAFTGSLPGNETVENGSGNDVDLRSMNELLKAQDKDFMNEISLYQGFYKQNDYKSCFPHWKTLYNKYPKATPNIYIQGAKMHEYFIENAKTDEDRDKYLNDLMKLYDKRIKQFGEEGYVLGRKGSSWLKYKLDTARAEALEGDKLTDAIKVGYEILNQSVQKQGNDAELPTLVLLMNSTVSLFRLGALQKETVVKNYDQVSSVLKNIIATNKDQQKVNEARDVQVFVENIFGKSGAADCEALVNIYKPQFEQNKDNIEFIKAMLRKLRRAKCDESSLIEEATIQLYQLEPSAEAAFNMAHSYLKKDDIPNAEKYYEQAIDQETDKKLLATYYYEYGLVLFSKDNKLAKARQMARKALQNDPSLCDAYILIGDIYVSGSRSYSGMEKSAVFWLAVDYYNKARASDDCAIEAAQKAAQYRRYFPNKEEAFMESLREGQSYSIGGWIGETTRVRF